MYHDISLIKRSSKKIENFYAAVSEKQMMPGKRFTFILPKYICSCYQAKVWLQH